MKKFILMCCAAAIMCGGFTACKSKKGVMDANLATAVELKKTRSQELAEDKPATRAWGEAVNFKHSFAKTYAEGQARAAFRRQLETIISAASREANDGAQVYHSDGENGSALGTDQGLLNDAFVTQMADGIVNGAMVINTDSFQQTDGQYRCYVCVEYKGDVADLAKTMSKQVRKRVEQQVSDEERAKMEVRHEAFEKAVEEKLKAMGMK